MIEKKYVPINFFMIYRSRIESGSLKRSLGLDVSLFFFISQRRLESRGMIECCHVAKSPAVMCLRASFTNHR